MSQARLDDVLKALDPPPGVKLWYGGASVLGSLRNVTAAQAAWKPAADRHSIWELALHIAYWRYAIRRKLTGEAAGTFPRRPSNWPAVPSPADEQAWSADRAFLRNEHRQLVEAVRALDPAQLDEKPGDGKWSYADLLYGVLMHDTYHTGQIQLLKRLAPAG